jgi:Flp pilus assembly protein TadG
MTILRRLDRRSHRHGRGQTLVEFALILPIFLLILMGLLDFGRVIYAQHTINQDAREGARTGAVSADGLSTSAQFTARFAGIRAAARVMAPAVPMTDASISGDPARGCAAVLAGVSGSSPAMPNDPTVSGSCFYPNGVNNSNTATPPKIVVRITVTVPLITPIISNVVGNAITVSAVSEQLLQ